jgi:hypothetical protein
MYVKSTIVASLRREREREVPTRLYCSRTYISNVRFWEEIKPHRMGDQKFILVTYPTATLEIVNRMHHWSIPRPSLAIESFYILVNIHKKIFITTASECI